MRLIAFVSGLAALTATPCLALTISSAPPSRDAAQHLKPTESAGPRLQDTFAGSGRPTSTASDSSGFTSGSAVYSNSTIYGSGALQTTITRGARDSRFLDRRNTAAPLGLAPRR